MTVPKYQAGLACKLRGDLQHLKRLLRYLKAIQVAIRGAIARSIVRLFEQISFPVLLILLNR